MLPHAELRSRKKMVAVTSAVTTANYLQNEKLEGNGVGSWNVTVSAIPIVIRVPRAASSA